MPTPTPAAAELVDPLAVLKAAEDAAVKELQDRFRHQRDAAKKYAEGTKLLAQAVDLETKGNDLQAAAIADMIEMAMPTADISAVTGIDPRHIRRRAKPS